MPPFVRLGWHGCQSGRHRQESGEGSSKFELRSLKEQPSVLLSQGSSEAEGDQTERVISERVPASEGGARASGMSEPREPSTTPQVFMARSYIDQVSR